MTTKPLCHSRKQEYYLTFSAGSPNPVSHEKPKLSIVQGLLLRPGLILAMASVVAGSVALYWYAKDTVPITSKQNRVCVTD